MVGESSLSGVTRALAPGVVTRVVDDEPQTRRPGRRPVERLDVAGRLFD